MKTENGVTTYYVYGRGLIGEEVNGAFKTYHFDYRGSTVALTDSTGNVTDTFEYDTYGSMTARTGTTVTPFLYNGRDGVMTDENGLVYMRARYYSPVLKRFINADVVAGSITNSITLNRYAYANGNPVSNIDPFGLSAERGGGSGKKHLPIAFGVDPFGLSAEHGNIMSNDRYTDVNGYYEWLETKPDHWDDFFEQSKQLWKDTIKKLKKIISIKRSISTSSNESYPFDMLGTYMPIILEHHFEYGVESENDSFATINTNFDSKTGWLSGAGLTMNFNSASIDLNISPDNTSIGVTFDISENVSQSYSLFINSNKFRIGLNSTTMTKSASPDNSYISSSSSLSLNVIWALVLLGGEEVFRYISENGFRIPQLPIPCPRLLPG